MHTRGPFCPCPRTAGSGQNTASLSVPTGPAPAWPGVNCPAAACPPRGSAGSRSPLPNTGGLCGAAGLNGGSVWPGMPGGGGAEGSRAACFMCLPGSGDRGQTQLPQWRHFHASANGMGSAVLHPTPRSLQHDNDGGTAGTWQGFPPSMCLHSAEPSCSLQLESQSLGRDVGMTPSHHRGG